MLQLLEVILNQVPYTVRRGSQSLPTKLGRAGLEPTSSFNFLAVLNFQAAFFLCCPRFSSTFISETTFKCNSVHEVAPDGRNIFFPLLACTTQPVLRLNLRLSGIYVVNTARMNC